MKLLKILNATVFLLATSLVMSIFYEGVTLQWYNFVAVLMIITDIAFIVTTILNLIVNKKKNIIFFMNIFSIIFICIVIIMKIVSIPYPKWGLIIWNFYILYFYGIQITVNIYKKLRHKNSEVNL